MTSSTGWTEAERTALRSAIASGMRSYQVDGKKVEYQDLAQMRAVLAAMNAELDSASAAPRYSVIQHNR